uniref:Uncharacterized protein n=1 Tax=Romanomermis culicivorax TaxID=13658 RepID=A0A915JGI6_ROMCU
MENGLFVSQTFTATWSFTTSWTEIFASTISMFCTW